MKQMTLRRENGDVVVDQCVVADSPVSRLKGLLGRSELRPGEGLLLRPASAIHTCFMRFPIDAVFLDDGLRVLRISDELRPGAPPPGAARVLCSNSRRASLPAGGSKSATRWSPDGDLTGAAARSAFSSLARS